MCYARFGGSTCPRQDRRDDRSRHAGSWRFRYAKVLTIGPCEVDSRDNPTGAQVVTGKIKHQNAKVWELVFNNDTAKPLGVTANHPIYSDDRDAWVPAGELNINEKVRATNGTATLVAKSQRPSRETVYNLEVHRAHNYYVSQFGILAHNANILNCAETPVFRGGNSKVARPSFDIKINKQTGLVVPEKSGLSVNIDSVKARKFGIPTRIKSIPEELQIIQQGSDPGHYIIGPKQPMTPRRLQELLDQVEFL